MRSVACSCVIALGALATFACGADRPAPHDAETRRPSTQPNPAASSTTPPPAGTDAAIAAAVSRISRASYEADLAALAHPRHHQTAPEGITAAAGYVERALARSGFSVRRQPVGFDGASEDNVIGERAGQDAPTGDGDVVVACAHYDAVRGTPGADDNASGVAGVLAVARALEGTPTRRAVRLIAFAFEEQGLVGSQAYVASLDAADRKRIRGVFNVEMIGYVDHARHSQRYPEEITRIVPRALLPSAGDFIGLLGVADMPGPLDAMTRARAYVPALKVVPVGVPSDMIEDFPDLLRSDHAPFWRAHIPAVMMGDTANLRTPHYHQPTDTIATLDTAFATDVARWTAAAVMILAEPRR